MVHRIQFCFLLQSTSTRIGSILPDRQADTLRPFPPFEVVRPFWMTLFLTIHDDQISPHPPVRQNLRINHTYAISDDGRQNMRARANRANSRQSKPHLAATN
ncbi:MAG: hypothetical protein DMG96_03320 [Acidobacteria bacterium]|nr:MAG: hypothetical protein DMG96_03320 [Acidobacteriota bacterium]